MTAQQPQSACNPGMPYDDPENVLVGDVRGITLMNKCKALTAVMQMPLPGIVIFVHGVNSDGEWYSQAEAGLCQGLNDRLKRNNGQIAFPNPAGGQLKPAKYVPDLTADGYVNPKKTENNFLEPDENFSPVIHFRWGYKASDEELQQYGKGLYLNERDYWGGGPFANGCTALPDLWGAGLSEDLFLFLQVQHLNPTNDRLVYTCPPRPYFVLAALRLACLISAIRAKQADVPITIVCHSQGNMIGMAAAFLGDRMQEVKDTAGKRGRCVADTYVLCNPPYSLVKSNFTEGWSSRGLKDANGKGGRQSFEARAKTLAAFFEIIRKQAAAAQDADAIDEFMKNEAHGFDVLTDRKKFGYGPKVSTLGRVTLYFNPHDQVTSASTVQGIGWRGLDQKEIDAVGGAGIFSQRVFAQGFKVGTQGFYDCWADHYNKPKRGTADFWFPRSPRVVYSIKKGWAATSGLGKVLTLLVAPLAIGATSATTIYVNAVPPNQWRLPLNAPNLPEAFEPESLRYGKSSTAFDQGSDAPGEARDKSRVRPPEDPYAGDHRVGKSATESSRRKGNDAAEGNEDSEAALRYEHHALLRMQAKRGGLYKAGDRVSEEDDLRMASERYKAWRTEKIRTNLRENVDTHATDHSTIMTNPMHAQKVLTYDVAIGMCSIKEADLQRFRLAADWRLLAGLGRADPNYRFIEYFLDGKFEENSLFEWANNLAGEGAMPSTIFDKRVFLFQ